MKITLVALLVVCDAVFGAIRDSAMLNKLLNIAPVGNKLGKSFVPLTEIPPPQVRHRSGRRHYEDECTQKAEAKEVHDRGRVDIIGDYYDDGMGAKTVATVIIPDHIDYKHFEVSTQVPYLTVGPIEGIGYHHSTSGPINECEKIYQDHLEEQYSDEESTDYSEESLEVARMPKDQVQVPSEVRERLEEQYYDM